jgi:hypothetical protein
MFAHGEKARKYERKVGMNQWERRTWDIHKRTKIYRLTFPMEASGFEIAAGNSRQF